MSHPSLLPLTAALAGALALGCADGRSPTAPADPSAPALGGPSLAAKGTTTTHVIGRTPVEGSFTSGCTGELITFTVVFIGSLNIVSEPGNDNHVTDNLVLRGTGTGQTTGAKYVILEHFHHSFNTPSGPAPNGTIKDHVVSRLISQGSLPNEFVSFDIHFVFNGQGELTVKVHEVTPECRA